MHHMDVPVDYHMCGTMLELYQTHAKAGQRNRSMLRQLVGTDIENSMFKYRVSYRYLTFMIETFELLMKSCENFVIRVYSMCNCMFT